ncbi:MAG: DNA-3-methyladenine glycosylase I [Chloroflexota bacterium]
MSAEMRSRCPWPGDDLLYLAYHDHQWGVPVHNDTLWFEMVILEGFQAGLSWLTILRKRENFRKAFDGFDVEKIATYTEDDITRLMNDVGIVRNRQKISITVSNAHSFIAVQQEFSSFDRYIWSFTDGQQITNHFTSMAEVPAETDLSRRISKDLKTRGFRFVGPTIVYALMQAAGIVNDHLTSCYRHAEIANHHSHGRPTAT